MPSRVYRSTIPPAVDLSMGEVGEAWMSVVGPFREPARTLAVLLGVAVALLLAAGLLLTLLFALPAGV
jgi:hypothetical protein